MPSSIIFSYKAESYFWQPKNDNLIVFKRLYSLFVIFLFITTFLVLFPAFFLFAQKKSWNKYAYRLTNTWGWFFMTIIGMKVNIDNRNRSELEKPCIYVANHFSYIDIATLPLLEKNACFVGKQSITSAPLFGYFFSSLHIGVNRKNIRERAKVIEKSVEAIKSGKSLFIFPEGGIQTKNPPYQVAYKDGAFRTAIEMKIPIVPVTLTNNWRLLPDDGKFLFRDNHIRVTIHEAINTTSRTDTDIASLRDKTFAVIQEELINSNLEYINV